MCYRRSFVHNGKVDASFIGFDSAYDKTSQKLLYGDVTGTGNLTGTQTLTGNFVTGYSVGMALYANYGATKKEKSGTVKYVTYDVTDTNNVTTKDVVTFSELSMANGDCGSPVYAGFSDGYATCGIAIGAPTNNGLVYFNVKVTNICALWSHYEF